MYWKITSNENKSTGCYILPAGTSWQDQAALKYAQDRIEAIWDEVEEGSGGGVSIELCPGECLTGPEGK